MYFVPLLVVARKGAFVSRIECGLGLLDLTRPVNTIVAGILTFIGAFVAQGVGVVSSGGTVAIASVVTILATGAGNALNDYFDQETDHINNPKRPIPRGSVTPRAALVFSVVLFGIAGGLALTLPVIAATIAIVNIAALAVYTEFFKGLPGVGNLIVAYLGGSTFLFGGAAVGNITAPGILFVLAALAMFTREVIKDVEDLTGDQKQGLNTLPIAIGKQPALYSAAVILCLMVAITPAPYLLGTFGRVYLVLVAPANLAMLYAASISFNDPTAGQSILKYGMFLTAAAFIVGRAAVVL